MSNVIEFPLEQIFDRKTFDKCQEVAKEIAADWVMKAEYDEEYPLALAMASGHALAYPHKAEIETIEKLLKQSAGVV